MNKILGLLRIVTTNDITFLKRGWEESCRSRSMVSKEVWTEESSLSFGPVPRVVPVRPLVFFFIFFSCFFLFLLLTPPHPAFFFFIFLQCNKKNQIDRTLIQETRKVPTRTTTPVSSLKLEFEPSTTRNSCSKSFDLYQNGMSRHNWAPQHIGCTKPLIPTTTA